VSISCAIQGDVRINRKCLKKFENVNLYISIYFSVGVEIGDIEFCEKYKMPVERAGRKIMMNIKNSARPYLPSKRRKLTRL
jgi:hypothetical protein